MTAIAFRDGVMAADSAVCGGDIVRGSVCKVVRWPVERELPARIVAAAAGHSSIARKFLWWVKSGAAAKWIDSGVEHLDLHLDSKEGEFGAILAADDGRVICFDWRGHPISGVAAPYYVEGSGEYVVIGALAAGATAVRAVEIACEYDVHCRGPVRSERLG